MMDEIDLTTVETKRLMDELVSRAPASVIMLRMDEGAEPSETHLLIGQDGVASLGLARIACAALERDLAGEVFGSGDHAG